MNSDLGDALRAHDALLHKLQDALSEFEVARQRMSECHSAMQETLRSTEKDVNHASRTLEEVQKEHQEIVHQHTELYEQMDPLVDRVRELLGKVMIHWQALEQMERKQARIETIMGQVFAVMSPTQQEALERRLPATELEGLKRAMDRMILPSVQPDSSEE